MNFAAAIADHERLHPVPAALPDTFNIILGQEPPVRPATRRTTPKRQDHTITAHDGNTKGPVNGDDGGTAHVRMPVRLIRRINRLRDEMQAAYAEGRISVPTSLCERIPAWFIVEAALDEVEVRRARSARPRARK
jgi:hypothetical protein